jgi:hypothetical protein
MCNEMITRTAKSSNACNSVEVSSAKWFQFHLHLNNS